MTQDQIATYRAALKEARTSFTRATKRLEEISIESAHLNDEVGRLRRTITALAAMCSEAPGFDKFGITEACMEVMEAQVTTMSTSDVVTELENMGFDLTSQKNASASVHAVLTRLAFKGNIERVRVIDTDKQTEMVCWRGRKYDPKADEIPF